jgi:outer membrane protein
MKRLVIIPALIMMVTTLSAQKFGFVDSEYIKNNIPAFSAAQEKLEQLTKQWEQEISARYEVVEKMYKDYQNESVLLSQEMRLKREEAIIQEEKEVKDLQNKYFGMEGELFKKRQELIQPIQDEILKAIKAVADEGAYAAIFDTASGGNILFASPRYDVSDLVLEKMGY